MGFNNNDNSLSSKPGHVLCSMKREETIREKIDDKGNKWFKVYFGGGAHYKNWLAQSIEIFGRENLEIEEVDFTDLKCFEEDGEKAYRIWAKDVINEV